MGRSENYLSLSHALLGAKMEIAGEFVSGEVADFYRGLGFYSFLGGF